jgi:hypothetical protein
MGRPPIGKQAMSGAERQRRYLAKLLEPSAELAAKDREIAALKARIAELKAELARERAKKR